MAEAGSERRVRVVVLLDSLARPGGGERLAVENAIRLDPARYERTLCLTRWEDAFRLGNPGRALVDRLEDAGVRVLGMRRSGRFDLGAWRPLVQLLRDEEVDVLHGHLYGSNVWASLLGTAARTPAIVAHEHMWAYEGRALRPIVDREVIARLADAFIAVSEEGMRRMVEIERIPPAKIVLVPNGIAPVPPGDRAGTRRALGIGEEERVVGAVGHLRTEKAYDVLIAAAALMRERDARVRVVIVGEGPERSALEDLIDRLGLGSVVVLAGERDDVPDLLAAFDLAVCCSDFEGGPLSVMEYMSAALPIVATSVGGLPELLGHGRWGDLVPQRDAGAVAEAALGLLGDPDRAGAMGESASERVAEEFGVDAWARRMEGLYERLLAVKNALPDLR